VFENDLNYGDISGGKCIAIFSVFNLVHVH